MRTPKQMTKAELLAEVERLALEGVGQADTQPAYGWARGLDHDAGIYERLIGIGSDVGAMEKSPVQNFEAFTIDNVYSKLRPLFTKWGVSVLPEVQPIAYESQPREGKPPAIDARVVVVYRFTTPNGDSTSMRFASEGRDFSDKATNKAVQQAFKYGLIQMFMISTGEVDPDEHNLELDPIVHNEPVEESAPPKPEPTPSEKRMNVVKTAAWKHTEGEHDARVVEAQAIVEQAIAVFGGVPKNKADVDAIVENIDDIFEDDPDDGSGYGG